MGNGLTETFGYNNRNQLTQAQVASSTLTAVNRTIGYVDGSSHNNGSVQSITDQLNSARTESFTYDQINRLASASETSWKLGFTYDAWGNLLQQNLNAGSAPTLNVTVGNNNQMAGYSYDAAGNLTVAGTQTYQYDPENKLKSFGTTGATYSYDADGMRVVQTVGGDAHEYIVSGGVVLADHHGSDWTDYISIGGKRIAKADSFEDRIHTHGTNCSGCGSQYSVFTFPSAAGYAGYVIRSGDKLFLRQYNSSGAHGGMIVKFSDGTVTNWSASANDQDGYNLNNDGTQQIWHYRRVDLSSYAGKTLSELDLVTESTTGAGAWDLYFNDITLNSTDGTVRPIYNRNTSISLSMSGSSGVTGRSYEVNHLAGITATPGETTNYYHADHLASARTMSSVNGYPVWQATYLPYGYEISAQIGVNKFKFTDYQRDAESGLDYAKARYYNSTVGRFMSPDPAGLAAVNPMNPQTWNRYTYALNNPVTMIDPGGLCPDYDSPEFDATCVDIQTVDGTTTATTSTITTCYTGCIDFGGGTDEVIPGSPLENGDIAAGSLAQGIFNGPGMNSFWDATNSFVNQSMASMTVGGFTGGAFGWGAGEIIGGIVEGAATTATTTATAAAAADGDHIVLGLEAFGLERTAAQVGGRTLMNDVNWQATLQTAVVDPSARFTISLDGVSGTSPYSQFMSAAQRGFTPGATPFNWEMGQLYQAGRQIDSTFVQGGAVIPNPFR